MSKHFFRDAVEQSIESAKSEGLPLAKFTLSVHITANSQEELANRIRSLDINWCVDSENGARESIDSTDGTTSIVLRMGNPEQTPENYSAELSAWSQARRIARESQDSRSEGVSS